MNSLYPDILFHFTSYDGLCKILENSFNISYSVERICANRKSISFGVPMVSFCDIRLSDLKVHMSKYGNYGIGLSKSWANKNGLSPVLYMNKYCSNTSDFLAAVNVIYKELEKPDGVEDFESFQKAYMNILNMYRYIKNYEGTLKRRSGKTTRNYRFADEREWRYVPPLESDCDPIIPLRSLLKSEGKLKANDSIKKLKLEFEPEDVKYLIVERDDQRLDLIRHLDNVKGMFDDDTKRRLTSRILTSDQIKKDV